MVEMDELDGAGDSEEEEEGVVAVPVTEEELFPRLV